MHAGLRLPSQRMVVRWPQANPKPSKDRVVRRRMRDINKVAQSKRQIFSVQRYFNLSLISTELERLISSVNNSLCTVGKECFVDFFDHFRSRTRRLREKWARKGIRAPAIQKGKFHLFQSFASAVRQRICGPPLLIRIFSTAFLQGINPWRTTLFCFLLQVLVFPARDHCPRCPMNISVFWGWDRCSPVIHGRQNLR